MTTVEGILRSASKIKLKGGVVGKVSVVLIVASSSMAVIAWSVKVPWISAVALALVFVLTFPMLWRLISFADKNPQAALLEGAEFLVHEQIRLGMKGQPVLEADSNENEQPAPLPISSADPKVNEKDILDGTPEPHAGGC